MPPKITISHISNFSSFNADITSVLGTNAATFKAATNGNVIIAPHTDEAFRTLISELKPNYFEYHIYSLKSEKPYRVVIRGLHHRTAIDIIEQELKT